MSAWMVSKWSAVMLSHLIRDDVPWIEFTDPSLTSEHNTSIGLVGGGLSLRVR